MAAEVGDKAPDFTLPSDSWEKKHEAGFPERAYFIIDREGVVRARRIEASPGDQPEIETVLEDLEKAL